MEPEQTERYVRWQEYRITHLSFAINLFLGFAVASLAYVINLKLEQKPHSSIPIGTIIIWWSVSAAFGCIATMSKLLDYRYTARKIKDGGAFNTFMAKYCGSITWGSFWVQVVTYAVGAAIFILGVVNATSLSTGSSKSYSFCRPVTSNVKAVEKPKTQQIRLLGIKCLSTHQLTENRLFLQLR